LEFFGAVRDAIYMAADKPESCASVRSAAGLRVRFLPVHGFPYRVVFLHEPEVIVVLAVAHSRRRPGYWRDRS
jgi:toxin ParE1/3/4